jgi:hypothetical protein
MKVYELSADERKAFETALQPMYEKGRSLAGETWVNDAVQFRKDWDAGKYKAQETKYIEDFKKISVPVNETMANFK